MYRFVSSSRSPRSPLARLPASGASRGEALQSLVSADGLRDRFFSWRGTSGRRYVSSVFQIGETGFVADVTSGLIIGVARNPSACDGAARPVGLFRAIEGRRTDAFALRRMARETGVTEWHVLFGADDATMQDLAASLLN